MAEHHLACKLDKVCQLHADYGSKCHACAKLAHTAYKQATDGNTADFGSRLTAALYSNVYMS